MPHNWVLSAEVQGISLQQGIPTLVPGFELCILKVIGAPESSYMMEIVATRVVAVMHCCCNIKCIEF